MQNKDLCSRLLQVRLVGIKFSGATDLGQTDSSTFILRVCNINGDRYVVSNDVPYCRLRIWDWAKSRNLRVYSLNDKKMLNVIPLHLPPLRDRKKDIRPLVDFFLRRICSKYDMKKCFDEDAYNVFISYPWPGNIRELRNIVERTAIMSQHPVISEGRVRRELHHYSSTGYDTSMKETIASSESDTTNTITADTLQYTPDFSSSVNLKEIIESIEARYIINAYDSCQSIRKAARLLSMDPATYLRKYRKYTDS
jgi:transcriptional regulator with AAA-type ATPase domain